MNTNSKEIKKAIQEHLLGAVYNEMVDQDNHLEPIVYIKNRFENEHNYNVSPNGFIDWLKGLAIDTLYYNKDIVTYLESIGLPKPEDKDEMDSVDLYFWLLAREYNNLLRKIK